jgi:hypothetical protein
VVSVASSSPSLSQLVSSNFSTADIGACTSGSQVDCEPDSCIFTRLPL